MGVSLPRPEFILGPRKARTRGPGSGRALTSAFAALRRDAEPSPFPPRGGTSPPWRVAIADVSACPRI